jgi:S-methylmethionine-dependent homocysteine/selenocysteine methylase
MSSATEGRAAAKAACLTGKPVWVAWTLREDRSGNLRSGESVAEAVAALKGLPVSGFPANCCPPESITAVMPQLVETGAQWIGGYANTFAPVPQDWRLDGEKDTDGLLTLRSDLGPEEYSVHVFEWLAFGATAVGGCCGTRSSHTAKMRVLLDEKL